MQHPLQNHAFHLYSVILGNTVWSHPGHCCSMSRSERSLALLDFTMEHIETQLDEIEVLQSILCEDGEMLVRTPQALARLHALRAGFEGSENHDKMHDVMSTADDVIPLVLELNLEVAGQHHESSNGMIEQSRSMLGSAKVQLVLTLPLSYPDIVPDISVSSHAMTRAACERLKTAAVEYRGDLIGQSMLLDLVQFVKDNAGQYLDQFPAKNPAEAAGLIGGIMATTPGQFFYCIIQLDHMHARASYCKTLKSWCSQLSITGFLLFQNRLILIVLEAGDLDSLATYLRWHRTRPVDEDTAGRTCKEHCLKVLMDPAPISDDAVDGTQAGSATQGPHASMEMIRRFSDFTVQDVGARSELQELFAQWNMSTVYREFVEPAISKKG